MKNILAILLRLFGKKDSIQTYNGSAERYSMNIFGRPFALIIKRDNKGKVIKKYVDIHLWKDAYYEL